MINTLKGKVSLIYLCLVLLIALVGAVPAINLYQLSRATEGLMNSNYRSINAVAGMMEAFEAQDDAVIFYINADRKKGEDLFFQNGDLFSKSYIIQCNNITEPDEQEHVEQVTVYHTEYTKLFFQLQQTSVNQGREQSMDFYNAKMAPVSTSLKQELKQLSYVNERAMVNNKNKATQNATTSMYLTLIISAIAVIGGFLLSRFFIKKLLMPLHNLTESVKLVTEGNYNQQIHITTHDEIGVLANEFNNMTKRLLQYEQSTLGRLLNEKNKSVAIVKSIYDPLVVLDNNYKILVLNNAFERFFNTIEGKVTNRHFLEIVQNGEIFEHISSIMQSDEENREKIILINMRKEYYLNVIVTKLRDAETNISGVIVVFQNVTELKQLEQAKTNFIATISHEFKTPLTSIMMGASLMQNDNVGMLNDKQKGIISTIQEDGQRLSVLVSDLLQLTKIESATALYRFEPCSISEIVNSSMRPLLDLTENKGVNLYYEAGEDLPKVKADSEKLIWAINNLITNAIKYTSEGDEIVIDTVAKDNKMYVSVKDMGIGIPPEYLEKIFDKFVQVEGQDLEVRGTGLGLAIVKEIIESHEGEIWCESKLDEGSNFIFTLPLSK